MTWAISAIAISAAEIAAVTPVVPVKIVVRLLALPVPFHRITEHGVQPVPPTPNKKAGFPAVALEGVSKEEEMNAGGWAMGPVNVTVLELEVVVEVETVTAIVPGNAVSAAEIVVVSCAGLTNTVGRGAPFQFTTSPFTKFVPFTDKVRPENPQDSAVLGDVVAVDAESDVIVGATI